MNPIAWIDLVSALACLCAAVFLIRGWKRPGFLLAIPLLLLLLAAVMMLYAGAMFVEWSGLAARFRWHFYEDFVSLFIPFVWAFFFYAVVKYSVEQELRTSRAHYRDLVESTNDWIWEVDANARYTYCGPQILEILGYSPDEMLGKTPFDFMKPAEAQRVREYFKPYLLDGKPFCHLENAVIHRDGSEVILETSGMPVFDAKRRLIGYRGVDRDITARKQAELELDKSRQEMARLMGNLPGAAYRCLNTPGWPALFMSRGCLGLTGYTDQEFISQQVVWNDLIVPEDRTRVWEEIQEALQHHTPYQIEYRIIAKDGAEKWFWEKGCGIFDADGQVIALEGFITDITERQKARQALMFTQFAVDRAGEEIYWIMSDARFAYVNEAVCRTLDYSRDELLTMTVADIDPDFPKERWPAHWQELKEQKALRFETHHKTRGGRVFPVEVTANFLVYDGVEYNCALARDITDRKIADQTREILMRQLQAKNEELQSIVFIASHDLRSPLVNIRGFTGELEKDLAQLEETLAGQTLTETAKKKLDFLLKRDIPESVRFIKTGSQKMDMLLNGLTRLSRIGTFQMHPARLDMNAMMQAIVRDLQFQISSTGITVQVQPDLPACRGDTVLISQVFTNLIDNAIKYRHPQRPCVVRVSGQVCGDGKVEYAVADNGIGIAPEHIEKVFELFHQLNPQLSKGGEGLGLTIVRRILDRQDGMVRIESEPDVGTTVFVELPAAIQ